MIGLIFTLVGVLIRLINMCYHLVCFLCSERERTSATQQVTQSEMTAVVVDKQVSALIVIVRPL